MHLHRTINVGNPINWSHPLNRGLVCRLSALPNPGIWGGNTWRDLVGLSKRAGNNGTLTNGASWGDSRALSKDIFTGKKAILLDGTNDYVQLPIALQLTGPMTVIASIVPGSISGSIISDSATGSSRAYNLRLSSQELQVVWNGTILATTTGTACPTNTALRVGFSRSGSTGSWVARTYVDGRERASQSTTTNPIAGNTIRIGQIENGTQPLGGLITDVLVYNRAISATEFFEDFDLAHLPPWEDPRLNRVRSMPVYFVPEDAPPAGYKTWWNFNPSVLGTGAA